MLFLLSRAVKAPWNRRRPTAPGGDESEGVQGKGERRIKRGDGATEGLPRWLHRVKVNRELWMRCGKASRRGLVLADRTTAREGVIQQHRHRRKGNLDGEWGRAFVLSVKQDGEVLLLPASD